MGRFLVPFLVAVVAIALASYVAVAFFVHPFADDFSYAVAGMRTALLPRLLDEYNLWNGRWFSNILVLRGPLVLGMEQGLWLYRLVPLALLALTWGGFFALIRAWMDPVSMPRRTAALGASILLLLYLHLIPDPSEGIYWYTGAVSYQLPGALMLLLIAAWVHFFAAANQERVRLTALIALVAMIICGCSELHMILMVLFHAVMLGMSRSIPFPAKRSLVIVFACVLFAASVMFFAPGNAGRGGQFLHRHELLHTVLWGGLQTGRFLLLWILSPALLLGSALYLSVCGWILDRSRLLRDADRVHPLKFALFILGVVFVSMALPYWTTGLLGQHRTVNAVLLFFLPSWFFLLTLVYQRRLRAGRVLPMPPLRYRAIACLIFGLALFATGNGRKVAMDLISGRLQAFDHELHARYDSIEAAKASAVAEIELPPLTSRPQSLRYLDGNEDPGHWINRSMAYYFDADTMSIRIGSTKAVPKGPLSPR